MRASTFGTDLYIVYGYIPIRPYKIEIQITTGDESATALLYRTLAKDKYVNRYEKELYDGASIWDSLPERARLKCGRGKDPPNGTDMGIKCGMERIWG